MIYLLTLGGASIEIDSARPDTDDAESLSVAPPHVSARVRLTPSAPRRFALLLYLAVERGRRVSRERLQNLIFPDQSPARARHSLRELFYQLRAAGALILADHDDVVIPPDQVWCDAWAAMGRGPLSEKTVHAITGGFLTGYAPEHSEAYTEWYEAYRATSISSLTRRLLEATNLATNQAQWGFAERTARACLAIDPLNEGATLALAGILAVNGSKATAIDLVDRYVAEVGSQSTDLKFPAIALRRRISEGLPSRHLIHHRLNGDSANGSGHVAPPMVGRAPDLAALQDAFGHVRGGSAQCVIVAGEAGIGKTRLVAEFSATAALQGARVERVTIQPHDGERPMGAFVDLVPALLRARGALGCSPASMDALRNLIGRQTQGELPQQNIGAEEHEQRWSAVSRAVVDLCEAIASEGTVVLVIEDAHWLDTLSANTIGRIIGAGRLSQIMIVATTRDPRPLVRDIRLSDRCRTLALAPLDAPAARELLDALIPAMKGNGSAIGGEESLKSRIAEVSAGNPLFLISLAAHSRAHPGEFKVPGTIVETFGQRIDGLSRRALSVLATCAQLGKHSTLDRLVRSLEMRKHELLESLLELTDLGLVLREERSAIPTHPLVSEALRGRMPEPVRRAVSYAVASSLEADIEGGASPSLWWDAAESWRVADNPARAVHALRQCARHALQIGRPGEAARILDEAAELPQSSESLIQLIEAQILAADAANEFALVVRAHNRVQGTREKQRHDAVEIAALRGLEAFHRRDEVVERLLECIRAVDATPAHRVEAGVLLLKSADMSGRTNLRDITIAEIDPSDLAAVSPLLRLEFELLSASTSGDRAGGASLARGLIDLCRNTEESSATPLKYYRTAAAALELGGFPADAAVEYQRLFELARNRGSCRAQQAAATRLAAVLWDCDRHVESNHWLRCAVAIGDEQPDLAIDFDLIALRLESALFNDQFSEAQRVLEIASREQFFESEICRRWTRAASLAIKAGLGHLDSEAHTLASRIGHNGHYGMTGTREFEVAVATEALCLLGALPEASEILANYLENERADLRPLGPLLRRAAERLRNLSVAEHIN